MNGLARLRELGVLLMSTAKELDKEVNNIDNPYIKAVVQVVSKVVFLSGAELIYAVDVVGNAENTRS